MVGRAPGVTRAAGRPGTRRSGSTGTILGSSYAPKVLADAGGTGRWRLKASCTRGSATFTPTAVLALPS